MKHPALDDLYRYLDEPTDELLIEVCQIGRVKMKNIAVRGRGAAFAAIDLIEAVIAKTQRAGTGKRGTRYRDPLPLCAPARLLSVEIEDFLKHQDRRGLKPDSIANMSRAFKFLLIACGDIPVSHIDQELIYKAWDFIRWSPLAALKHLDFEGQSPDELAALGRKFNVAPLAESTVSKNVRFLVTFFKKLESSGAIRLSPMEGIGMPRKNLTRPAAQAERFFEDKDLQRIFDPTTYLSWAQKYPHRWWCPLLAMYTGARVNEVAQLKLIDIVEEAGRWCIAIQQTEDADLGRGKRMRSRQSIKGASAMRTIPLHDSLIQAGFLEFVQDMRALERHTGRLFPHLSAGMNARTGETNARYSQAVLNQFSTYLKDLDFPKGIGFHAFRHTFVTNLSQRQVSDADIALLTGHSRGGEYRVVQVYKKRKPQDESDRKWAALQTFNPAVSIPRYRRGQFAKCLSDPSKFYP